MQSVLAACTDQHQPNSLQSVDDGLDQREPDLSRHNQKQGRLLPYNSSSNA